MSEFGRALQIVGLLVVPMALMYYFSRRGEEHEAKLMFGELSILAAGVAVFALGYFLARK